MSFNILKSIFRRLFLETEFETTEYRLFKKDKVVEVISNNGVVAVVDVVQAMKANQSAILELKKSIDEHNQG